MKSSITLRGFLSMHDKSGQQNQGRRKTALKPGRLTVLVAEDDALMLLLVAAMLRKNGYTVLEARDGAEAWAVMRERSGEIAAVLSDIYMPNINGLELAALNFQGEALPFIIYTSAPNQAITRQLFDYNVRDYLVKPVKEAVLVTAIHNAIERGKTL